MNSDTVQVNQCIVCRSQEIVEIIQIPQLPVLCNALCDTRQEALHVERADMDLVFCQHCGHVFNRAFEAEKLEYVESYENSLHFSQHFSEYAQRLAADLIQRYELYGKDILEIGSGRGDFLKLMVQQGQNRGVGFDPSYAGENADASFEGIRFIQDYFSQKYAGFPADFVICRHVLEHIPDPRFFLSEIRQVVSSMGAILFFEVPNVLYTLREMGIWDLIYEHCSYFSKSSLQELFESSGFEVLQVSETFGSQFLTIEARVSATSMAPTRPDVEFLESIYGDVQCFSENYRNKLDAWQTRLEDMKQAHERAVIWGAGSKGISFLNTFASGEFIHYAVDINPRKEGKFISGSGQKIIMPEFLVEYQPHVVVLLNPNYQAEVKGKLQDLGLQPQVLLA
jgi:SAM-dependent methyltransferase